MKTLLETPPGWKPIHVAPAEIDICICVADAFGLYPLPFPCRKLTKGWINARQGVSLDIVPLGWREWIKRHSARW